jgi:acyl-CoA synthetase (AMP-forming)/AMP-acid ligase II
MPRETLAAAAPARAQGQALPDVRPDRGLPLTYLPPEEVDRRPDSIGKAIPNAEILVLREDGTECAPDEPGELVHRGALVGQGYWNDAEKTAERYKLLPPARPACRAATARVRRVLGRHGAQGRRRLPVLHRPARRDDEDLGLPRQPDRGRRGPVRHQTGGRVRGLRRRPSTLGQAIQVIATPPDGSDALDVDALAGAVPQHMPAYMVPHRHRRPMPGPLPRNPNGKIDRKLLSTAEAPRSRPVDARRAKVISQPNPLPRGGARWHRRLRGTP